MFPCLTLASRKGVITFLAAVLLVTGISHGQQPSVLLPAGPVTITVPAAFTLEQGDGFLTIRWGKAPSPVEPPPPPTPTPVVTTQNPVWIIAVVDKATQLPAGQAAIRDSKTLATRLKDYQAEWRVYAPGDPLLASWTGQYLTPPSLFVIEIKPEGAAKFQAVPLPADEAGVIQAAKAIRGKF